MHCPTAWGHWAVQLLQYTAALPGGSGQRNSCTALPQCPGAVGSGTPATHCLTAWEQWAVQLLQCTASLPWGQWAVQLLQWGCTTGRTGLGGWGVQPRGWSGHPSGPMGGHHLRRTGRIGLGGTGSPGQGVVGASCRAHGEASSANNRAHRPGADGEPSPGGGRNLLQGPWGAIIFQ